VDLLDQFFLKEFEEAAFENSGGKTHHLLYLMKGGTAIEVLQ
jgi:hypothetical protein